MTSYETYVMFLCLKQHFTKPNYDVFKYNWKTRASLESFTRRTDKYFFEKLSRKKSESEIKEFYIANFIKSDNPKGVYISDLIRDGDVVYNEWRKYNQSLFYNFKVELEVFVSTENLNTLMECKNTQHSLLIRKYLQKLLSLETLVILDKIFNFTKSYDKILLDPIWESLSLKIKKYSPFLSINKEKYIKIMKETVCV
jgi:hypothetical protein